MNEDRLTALDPSALWKRLRERSDRIEAADEVLCKHDTSVNTLAERLHPKVQYMKIAAVTDNAGAKTYRLIPDHARGTSECAYFQAGQYLSVSLNIGGKPTSRPYSLTSAPREALCGFYEITVKPVPGGAASDHILSEWRVGTEIMVSAPLGHFTYEPLRDAGHIVGFAGGSGVTPFLSLAKAIADGDERCTLTLLYGSRTKKDILFRQELAEITHRTQKIRVVHVLSDEICEDAEHGLVDAALIARYLPQAPYSVFLCGPEGMVSFADRELARLHIEPRRIRHELRGEVLDPTRLADCPSAEEKTVRLTVHIGQAQKVVSGTTREPVLRILERGCATPPTGCRSGECGFCRSRLIAGDVWMPKSMDKRRQADAVYGYIHPCCSYPLGDLELEIFPPATKEKGNDQNGSDTDD